MATEEELAIARRLIDTEVASAIDKATRALVGTPAGVGTLALLSLAVTLWKKTRMPIAKLHETIDALAKTANETIDN